MCICPDMGQLHLLENHVRLLHTEITRDFLYEANVRDFPISGVGPLSKAHGKPDLGVFTKLVQ